MLFKRVELEPPQGWSDMSMMSFVGPEEKGFRPSLLLSHEPLAGDLDAYARRALDQLKLELPKYKLHKQEETKVDGARALVLDHTFHGDGGLQLRQMQLLVAKGGVAYTLTITHLDKQFEPWRDRFASIARGLRLG